MKRNIFLRVKLKSLAEEARIIRAEEAKANRYKAYDTQARLREHRAGAVRKAARETVLAYQYLRGIPYAAVEQPDSKPIDWSNVRKMIHKYGHQMLSDDTLRDWQAGVAVETLKVAHR